MGTDSEGEEINVNKVSQALRTAGINMNEFLTGAKGLDEIFIELASKWDSLTTVQQRYIATTAAGSRQQSRFIALMSDYDRTMELTNMANNSAGASNQQYEKTLDSLESKLNQLQNAWNQFLMGIANSDIIKFGIDVLTGLITAINKITDGLPGVASGFAKIGVAILALKGGSAIFNALIAGFKAAGGTAGVTFGKAFRTSLTASLSKVSKITNLFKFDPTGLTIPKNATSSLEKYTAGIYKSQVAQKALRGEVEGYILTDERRAILSRQIAKADAVAAFATEDYATAMGLTNAQAEIAIAMDGKQLTSQQILSLAQTKINNQKKEEILQYLAANNLKLTGSTISKMVSAGIITEAQAQKINNMQQKKGLPALIANIKAKLKLTAANSSGVVAQIANWLATKMQTDANYKLWISLGVILVAIIAIIAVVIIIIALIALVIKGIKAFIKNIKDSTPENKVKALQERYKELSEAQDAVNSKLDELNSKHDELEDMNKKFEDLVEGTTEWKKNLIDINSQVLALIQKYPKLTNYLQKGEYGQLEIREEGWDTIISEELEAASKIQTAMLATQKQTNIASNEVDFENREDIEGNKVFGDTSRDAWDWAAEMGESFAGPFNMITDLATEGWDESKINWKKIIPNMLLPGDIVAGLVRGLAETDEDREKIATGGLTQDQYYDFAAAVAEAGYTVTSGEDWDEIKALYLSMGEGYKESDWENIRSKMEELGASFDELAISAEGVSIANRELERQVQQNIVDAIGITPDEDAYDMLTNIAMNGEETSEEAIARLEDEIWKNEGVNDSGETNQNLRKRYAEEMGYYFNEDDDKVYTSQGGEAIEIDEKTMLNQLAANKYQKEQELQMRKYNNMLSKISNDDKKTPQYKALQGILSENGKNFTTNSLNNLNEFLNGKGLSSRTEENKAEYDKALNEYFNQLGIQLEQFNLDYNEIAKNIALGTATQESLYEKAQASGIDTPIRNAIDKLSNSLSTYEIELDTATTKDFIDNFMQAYEQSGQINDIEQFSSYLSQIIDAAGSEEAAQSILAQLSAIDYTDVENLDSAITQLATDFPQLNSLLTDDFKEGLINASQATMNYSEELNNNVKDNFINAKNTYDKLMESGTYTLSAEDKDILIKAKAATESDFISTGITGSDDEFTFVGNTDSLLQKINNSIHDTYKYGETDENGEVPTADQIIAAQDKVEKAKAAKKDYDERAAESGYNESVTEIFSAGGGAGNNFTNTDSVENLFKGFVSQKSTNDRGGKTFAVNSDYLATLPSELADEFKFLTSSSEEGLATLMREKFIKVAAEKGEDWIDLYNGNTINTELQEAEQTLADLQTSGYEYYKGKILNAQTVGEKQNAYTEFINAFGNTDIYDFTQMAAMEKLLSGSITANYRSVEGGEAQFNYLTEQYQDAMKGTDEYNAALSALATTEAKIQSAIDTTSDSISDSIETMKTADKGTIEYNKALGTLSTGMDQIFDSQSNLLDSTEMQEFTESNLSDIQDWAEGSEVAGNRVAQAFALASSAAWGAENDISAALTGAKMSADMSMSDFMNSFANWIGDLEEGESIVIGDGNTMAEQYAHAIENMVNNLGLSVEQATAWLSYLGAEVVGEYDEDGNYRIRVITEKSFTGAYSGFGGYDKSKDDGGSDQKYYEPDYDVFYNIVKDLEDISRNLDDLSTQYERMTNDPNTNYKDILKNLTERSELLQDSVIKNRALLEARKSQAQDIMNDNADLQQYAKFNQDRNIVEIDYDLIQAQAGVMTEEEGQRLDEYITQLEEMQSEAEKLEDALNDNYDALEELKNIGKEQFLDLEQRIYDALVQQSQDQIDKLSNINDSINDANSKLLDTIRSNLDKIRQDRDNEKQEEEINDTAAQLAYLSQDTSGGNQLEILGLQKELDDQRQSYTDALIDQKISELEEQNAKAEEQREQQIDILQSQLDYDKEHGQFWDNVEQLMNNAYGTDGAIISGSMLSKVLKGADGWEGMSKQQQQDWENKYKTDITAAKTYMENQKSDFDAKISAIQTAANASLNTSALQGSITQLSNTLVGKFETLDSSIKQAIKDAAANKTNGATISDPNQIPNVDTNAIIALADWDKDGQITTKDNLIKKKHDSGIYYTSYNGITYEGYSYDEVQQKTKNQYLKDIKGKNAKYKEKQLKIYEQAIDDITAYKTGGLADFTGPAWLDGTKSKPELILNAKDTQNFIQLRDILAEIMGSNYQVNAQDKDSVKGGDNYFTIDISVDKLENDYDVEALAEQIKRMINDDAMYRNVNVINLLR